MHDTTNLAIERIFPRGRDTLSNKTLKNSNLYKYNLCTFPLESAKRLIAQLCLQ